MVITLTVCALNGSQLLAQEQRDYYNAAYDYSFTIPADWDTIPQKAIAIKFQSSSLSSSEDQFEHIGGLTYWNNPFDYFIAPFVLFEFTEMPLADQFSLDRLAQTFGNKIEQENEVTAAELYHLDPKFQQNDLTIDQDRRAIFFDYSMVFQEDTLRTLSSYFVGHKGVTTFSFHVFQDDYKFYIEDYNALLESVRIDVRYESELEARREEYAAQTRRIDEMIAARRKRNIGIIGTAMIVILGGGIAITRFRRKQYRKKIRAQSSGGVPDIPDVPNKIPYNNLGQFIQDLGIDLPKKSSGGKFVRVFGIGWVVLTTIVLYTIAVVGTGSYTDDPMVNVLVILVGGSLLLFVGYKIFLRGRKMEQSVKFFGELSETRRPIIYLRSFADDDPGITLKRYLLGMIPFYFNKVLFPHEEALSKVLREFGPVLAIGKPDENLPDIGATRIYTDAQGDKWQSDVAHMLDASQLVVLRAGISPGLKWEISKVFSQMSPEKVILYVDLPKWKYKIFVENFQQWVSGIQLPQADSLIGSAPFFIFFNAGFEPFTAPIKAPRSRHRLYRANTPPYRYGLQPLFDRNDMAWHKPKLNWFMIALMFLFVISVLLMGLAIWLNTL